MSLGCYIGIVLSVILEKLLDVSHLRTHMGVMTIGVVDRTHMAGL